MSDDVYVAGPAPGTAAVRQFKDLWILEWETERGADVEVYLEAGELEEIRNALHNVPCRREAISKGRRRAHEMVERLIAARDALMDAENRYPGECGHLTSSVREVDWALDAMKKAALRADAGEA